MILLVAFAFLAGIITILSPCILPILPIVLSGSITGGKRRPIGVVTGFIVSFTFFTLFLTAIVKATGVSADALRNVSVFIVLGFGLSLLIPQFQALLERVFSHLAGSVSQKISRQQTTTTEAGFISGLLVGVSLGLVWTPCVGPILASIITIAATSSVTLDAVILTFVYSLGTAIPLLAIIYGGRNLLQKVPWLTQNTGKIQKAFGMFMILTALAIYFSIDRKFQTYTLSLFPNYGVGLTKFENNPSVKKNLEDLQNPTQQKQSVFNILKKEYPNAPELIRGGKLFNIPKDKQNLTIAGLRGQVVLIDFWTYTCINCIRTLPYLKSWHTKYKNKGLVIIGVHTPEFEFEKNPDNVARAIKDFGLEYPIMQDNDYATWNAYNNRYWPAKYLIDKNGKIRYTHFGEGNYDETEKKIQELLKEAGGLTNEVAVDNPQYSVQARTPETYLGLRRMSGNVSPEYIIAEKLMTLSTPSRLSRNSFAFGGLWMIGNDYASPTKGASLTYHFDAAEVFLVMRPKTQGLIEKVKVFLDGQLVTEGIAGEDVKEGIVTVDADRLYKLIKLSTPGEHTLKLEFLDATLDLYAFTFG